MTDLAKRIAVLLANYEMDEPHVDHPDCAASNAYATFDWTDLQRMCAGAHDGDCVKQAACCMRCLADHWTHKGKWIADRLEEGK